MGIREWTIILGVVVGVAILLWLAARWRKRRYDEIFSYDSPEAEEPDLDYGSELPSGGARTVGYRDSSDIERMNDEIRRRADELKPRLSSFSPTPSEQSALFSDSDVSEPEPELEAVEEEQESEPVEQQVPLLLDPSEEHSEFEEEQVLSEPEPEESQIDSPPPAIQATPEPDTDVIEEQEKPENLLDETRLVDAEKTKQKEKTRHKSKVDKNRSNEGVSRESTEIIVVNLMTRADSPYRGATLWRALNELGMRFGDMDIFHYCGKHGDEPPQFRMANLLNPGVFDLEKFDRLRTHALCFFFELEPEQDNIAIYESMLSVISQLKDELGGEMRDDQRSVFTIQTSEHCRNKIRDFQRRHLVKKG